MEPVVERIVNLCELKGVPRSVLCKSVGINTSSFSNWVIRGGQPKHEQLRKIANYFNVSVTFLETGENPSINVKAEIEELVERISALPSEKQDKAISLMYNILNSLE